MSNTEIRDSLDQLLWGSLDQLLLSVAQGIADIRRGFEQGVYHSQEEAHTILANLDEAMDIAIESLEELVVERDRELHDIDAQIELLKIRREELAG